jgi:superfamily II DNA or RNA helicase
LKKGVYIPTGQNVVVIKEVNEYCEILIDGNFKMVSTMDINVIDFDYPLVSLEEFKSNVFLNILKNPVSDILYSYNSNRLVPEQHQYKPLFKFLNSINNRVLIADEVGLGKTIEAGMIFKEIDCREDLNVSIIVVPSSLTLKWQEEFSIRFDEYFEIKKTNQFLMFLDDYDAYSTTKLIKEKIIISYHTLRDERVLKRLKESYLKVDFLIMDEAHFMRNKETISFESGQIITSIAEHIIFLSATPVQNSISDLFNILSLLDNDYFFDFDYFLKMISPNKLINKTVSLLRNNHPLNEIKDFISNNISTDDAFDLTSTFNKILTTKKEISTIQKIEFINELTEKDHLSYIINRTKKKDVGKIIPRNAKSIIIELTPQEKEYYNAVIEFVKFINPDTPTGFITIMPERMASSSMKASLISFKEIKKQGKLFIKDIDDLDEYYEDLDIVKEAGTYLDKIIKKGESIGDNDSKFLKFIEIIQNLKKENLKQLIVFSFFKKTLEYLSIKLIELNYKVGVIHGDYSVEERFNTIKKFKNGDFEILLSSEVGSEGLDMQFGNVVVNYDLPWNPMRVEQRIGRIDRIGQKHNKLLIFNLCIAGSIEDRIYNRLYEKLNIFENSIGELEPILGNLEKELNISNLMYQSQNEIDEIIQLKNLALKRQELEIKEQNVEVEKLLNEKYQEIENNSVALNSNKIIFLQEQCRFLLLEYLNKNNIHFSSSGNDKLKISGVHFEKLLQLLKDNMSDKRLQAAEYKLQREQLQKIHSQKELIISFKSYNNDDFNTIYFFINNPIIDIIIKNKNPLIPFCQVNNFKLSNRFAIVFKININQYKRKSVLKTILIDENENVEELDFFDFILDCKSIEDNFKVDLNQLAAFSNRHIIKYLDVLMVHENKTNNRMIDVKVNSVKNHFEKQKTKIIEVINKINDVDIKRMKTAEIENITSKQNAKIRELERYRNISHSFETLGIIQII